MKARKYTKETVMDIGTYDRKFPKFRVGDAIAVAQKIKEESEIIKNRKLSEEKPVEDPNTFTPVKKTKKSLLGKLNERNKEET